MKGKELNVAGVKAYQAGKIDEAVNAIVEAIRIARRLDPRDEYPSGHTNLALSLSNLAALYQAQGKLADAEPLFRESRDVYKGAIQGDHPWLKD